MTEFAGERVVLRPLAAADAERLREIRRDPAVARWWHPLEPEWPEPDTPDEVKLTVWVGDEIAGLVQYGEQDDPDYRHANIDVFLDPAFHGQGLGADAVRTLARYLFDERGHHRITIDPRADNAAAIRSYERIGFRRVGVLRQYERDPTDGTWHDGLLMDLLHDDLT